MVIQWIIIQDVISWPKIVLDQLSATQVIYKLQFPSDMSEDDKRLGLLSNAIFKVNSLSRDVLHVMTTSLNILAHVWQQSLQFITQKRK